MRNCGGVEVADIFRQYGPEYRKIHPMPRNQLRAMRAIEVCRTAELGGHVDKCDHCGHMEISYNSCRNRHCPKCQFLRKEKWIEARSEDILPIQYFHVVFTIPEELNPIVLRNQKVLYALLFRSVSETLITLGRDPKHLGAHIGFIGVLHTWGQNLMDHPHIHCIVPGGGLSPIRHKWVFCRKKFFIHVNVLRDLFKKKFLAYLKQSYEAGKLAFPGAIAYLQKPKIFERFRKQFYRKKWVLYSKPPFGGTEEVIRYLGRYTHRIAISNHRIINVEDGRVSFWWRDYADGNKKKIMALDAPEFIRRFLLHVLPDRFVKIRHYGLLGSRNCKNNLTLCRKLLHVRKAEKDNETRTETWKELLLRVAGVDVAKCPVCQKGRMHRTEVLEPAGCSRSP